MFLGINEKRGIKVLRGLRDLLGAGVHPTVRDAGLTEPEAQWLAQHQMIRLGDGLSWVKDRDKTPFEDRFVIAEITETALSHLASSGVSPQPVMQTKVKRASSYKKRTKPSNTLRLRLFQEAGHHCAFCPEKEPGSLEVHHIDGNRSNRDPLNLIMVCASCHAKITAGVISETDVRLKKRQLANA